MNPDEYLSAMFARLASSRAVVSFKVVAQRATQSDGYFRARVTLANGDFLEVSEYFLFDGATCLTTEYAHQWMDTAQIRLIRRWDNSTHFPNLPNFPHHVHIGAEDNAQPGRLMSILDVLDVIERELRGV